MKNEVYPLVSIAIVTYNQELYIGECIESCLAQTYPNFEIIIADDYSSDSTREVLIKYKNSNPNKIKIVLAERNRGLTRNCNLAWANCRGDWIKTIAGDDKLTDTCLIEYVFNALSSRSSADVYFANMISFSDEHNERTERKMDVSFFDLTQEEKILYLYKKNPFFAPTSFIKRSSIIEVDYADERFQMLEDHPLWLKFAKQGYKFGYVDKYTVFYRRGNTLSQSLDRIGNQVYIESYFLFQRTEIWPHLERAMALKKVDDFALYAQRKFGILFLNNKAGFSYKLLKLMFLPLRVYSIFNKLSESRQYK